MKETKPYNPLDTKNLGISVAKALLEKDIHPLPPSQPMRGAGIYVLYYTGDFEPYRPIALANRDERFDAPVYIGRANAPGRRKGGISLEVCQDPCLFTRLRQHARSIEDTANLDVADFHCRYLVVDDIWIPLAESLLISQYQPAWNRIIDGFGNHDPGRGRRGQARSFWDVLHPGRRFAENLAENPVGPAELEQRLEVYFDQLGEQRADVLRPTEGD